MIWEGRRFGFRALHIVLEDDRAELLADKKRYQLIHVRSHRPLSLPGFEVRTKVTHLIDLGRSESEILAGFHASTRRKIRQSERDASLSFVSPDPDRSAGHRLYARFERNRQQRPSPFALFAEGFLFSGYRGGEMIAGVFADPCASGLRVRAFFSARHFSGDREVQRAIGFANRRLVWEACRFGNSRGFDFLDLASVNRDREETSGIAAFKAGFGGREVGEWIYEWRSPMVRALSEIRRLWWPHSR